MKFNGTAPAPIVLIHGGVNLNGVRKKHKQRCRSQAEFITKKTWEFINSGKTALETVAYAVELLEAEPCFNAGLGSALQSDAQARLTASIMNGETQSFSGVNLVSHIIHPSKLALALQNRSDRVLGPSGSQLLARELGIPPKSPVTKERLEEYLSKFELKDQDKTGTVGAVALDANYNLAAATSTGGRSNEYPDRMSDVGTIAGNFASKYAAISCSGIGEQIVDDGVAIRLESRVRDGSSLIEASEKTFLEAEELKHKYGWIGLDNKGNWTAYFSTAFMTLGLMTSEHKEPWLGKNLDTSRSTDCVGANTIRPLGITKNCG